MILVTGATGTVGSRVVARLRALGKPVRAVVRDPERAAFPDGVETVVADLADPASLAPHLRGVEAAFLLWPFTSPDLTARLAPQVVGTLVAQPRRVVYLSAAAAAGDPASFWAIVERTLDRSGLPHTILRPTGFAKNTLLWAPQIRVGNVVRWPYGRAARALIHEDDIAAVAVQALIEGGHDQAEYVLSGPAALTQVEQVRIIGDVLRRPLHWDELPTDKARIQLTELFRDARFADAALAEWAKFADHPEQVSNTVERVTGRPARSFHEWAVDHVADFR